MPEISAGIKKWKFRDFPEDYPGFCLPYFYCCCRCCCCVIAAVATAATDAAAAVVFQFHVIFVVFMFSFLSSVLFLAEVKPRMMICAMKTWTRTVTFWFA